MRLPKHGIFASVQLPKKTKRWLKDDIISFSYSRPCEVDPLTEIGPICPCSTPQQDGALTEIGHICPCSSPQQDGALTEIGPICPCSTPQQDGALTEIGHICPCSTPQQDGALTEIGHICPCSTPQEDDALIETWCISISLRSRSTWYIFHSEIETWYNYMFIFNSVWCRCTDTVYFPLRNWNTE